MPALTVHNAEIKTAAVEIRTLTISGKQVTLAVFRQLRSERWLDNELNPRGPAWGVVNYHPDPICRLSGGRGGLDGTPHIHMVWQLGAELRRHAFVDPTRDNPVTGLLPVRYWDDRDAARRFQQAWELVCNLPQLFIAV